MTNERRCDFSTRRRRSRPHASPDATSSSWPIGWPRSTRATRRSMLRRSVTTPRWPGNSSRAVPTSAPETGRGAEPLHSAVNGVPGSAEWNPLQQRAVILYLIEAGADPNATAAGGVTPLHRAVRNRCSTAVGALLRVGADPRRENDRGSTAFDLARWRTGRGGTGSAAAKAEQAIIIELLERAHLVKWGCGPSAGGLVAGFRPVCSDSGKNMVAGRLARVLGSRVIALAILSAVLLLLVLCLSMGAVSRKADETATRMFEHHTGESAIRLNGAAADTATRPSPGASSSGGPPRIGRATATASSEWTVGSLR